MTNTPEQRLLTWPGMTLPAVLTADGWAQVEPPSGFDFGFDPPIGQLPTPGLKGAVFQGERLATLRSLEGAIAGSLALAYLDFPRLVHASFAREHLRVSTWLSALQSHTEAVSRLLAPGGRIVVHVDDHSAALAMVVLDDLLGSSNREATILWQKKYGPQNDLRGRVDDAQDYLLVYSVGAKVRPARLESTWWPWQYAGKSEDATREAEQLRDAGVVTLPVIPKTSKPIKLVRRLVEAYTEPGELVLECFSDTGFASAAAIQLGRIPLLLGGETESELDRIDRCSLPRLVHEAGGARFVPRFILHPPVYTPARVAAAGDSIKLGGLAPSSATERELRPILLTRTGGEVPPSARGGFPSMVVTGDPTAAIEALEPAVRCDVTLAYFDWTEERSDAAALAARLAAATRLLDRDGVVAVCVAQERYGLMRLIAELELFGRDLYMGTIAVEPTDRQPQRLIMLFKALPQSRSGKIGLPARRGYAAEDGDPRGPWRDPMHKGARSGSKESAFTYRLPPYRWQRVDGELPPGAWQVNPVSGVIWSPRLTEAGTFRFKVRVTDSAGECSDAECTIEVRETGRRAYPSEVWWMERLPDTSAGPPRITSIRLPDGVVGEPYSAVLEATGGTPDDETTAPGEPTEGWRRTRYWEFSRRNLVTAILEDRAFFGATGKAKPRMKVYGDRETATQIVELSWWDAQRLGEQSAELRLVEMLAAEGRLVLMAGGESCRDVIRSGRRCVFLGDAAEELQGHFPIFGRVGHPVAILGARSFRPLYESPDYSAGLAWTLGFLPPSSVMTSATTEEVEGLHGISANGAEGLLIFDPAEWPTRSRCDGIARRFGDRFVRLHVLYYRGKPPRGLSPITFRRIPFDFAGARG